jgi:putative IMPACT (imprinted ancient) family translation regulator
VAGLSKEFHDATHVCFAWRIGEAVRAADAGEPAGTAGRPILSAIDSSGLDRVCVAVVRYFGGTKLGTAGLVRCYREAARRALEECGTEEIYDLERIEVEMSYDRVAAVKALLDPPHVRLESEDFGETARLVLAVRRSYLSEIRRKLRLPGLKSAKDRGEHES